MITLKNKDGMLDEVEVNISQDLEVCSEVPNKLNDRICPLQRLRKDLEWFINKFGHLAGMKRTGEATCFFSAKWAQHITRDICR